MTSHPTSPFANSRIMRAPRGSSLTTRSWQTEGPLRMPMNTLDPEVAERPEDLVVYGGREGLRTYGGASGVAV